MLFCLGSKMKGKTTTEQRKLFHKLIEEAEENLRRNPVAYRRKLGLLAGLGYIYIFGVLLLTLILIGLSIYGMLNSSGVMLLLIKTKLIIILPIVIFVLIKALWVKIDAPTGYVLNRKDYPILYKEVDAIQKKLKAPKVHQILLTPEFNAAIYQTPRLGILGWHKNTLILGLSLMISMDRDQCLSVIAHEFGHLSGNHSRFAGWIYRVRMTWMRVMDAFDQAEGAGYLIFGKFFDWYAPYFNSYSFALARANEYEADAIATEITSRQALVGALCQTYIAPDLMQKYYWMDVEKQVGETNEVNSKIYTGLYNRIKQKPFEMKEAEKLMQMVLKEETGHTDTHPALKDRIKPYTQKIDVPVFPNENAAEALFADKLYAILRDFDKDWADNNLEWWRERFDYLQKSQEELQKLEEKEGLNEDESWNLAILTEELEPEVDPLPHYQAFHAKCPNDIGGVYAIGRLLLERDDQEGISYLDKTLDHPDAVIPACELAYAFYKNKGKDADAEKYRLKAEAHMDLQKQAQNERADLYKYDEYIQDELSNEWLEELKKQFASIDGIKTVWVCRKKVKIFVDQPVYVFIYTSKWWKSHSKLDQAVLNMLQFPEAYFVINKKGEHKKYAKKALMVARKIMG